MDFHNSILPFLLALFGAGGIIGTIYKSWSDRDKRKEETHLTGAESTKTITESSDIVIQAALKAAESMMKQYRVHDDELMERLKAIEIQNNNLKTQSEALQRDVRAVVVHVARLENLLSQHGLAVPDRPEPWPVIPGGV